MVDRLRIAVSRIASADAQQLRQFPPLERSLVPILALGSIFYKSLLFLRHKLYQWKIFTPARLCVPVVSVGNISWGGNGKTPMVEYLAGLFLQCDISPLILTRGYGGGDEVRLLEGHLHGRRALIGVGHNRVKVAATFLKRHGVMSSHDLANKFYDSKKLNAPPSLPKFDTSGVLLEIFQTRPMEHTRGIGVILLDDGMQHWKIHRDIEIVMVNAVSIFGNEMLLPHGPLREPLDALRRADILVIHHTHLVPNERLQAIRNRLTPILHPETVIFYSQMVPRLLMRVPRAPLDFQSIFKTCTEKNSDLLVPLDVIHNAHVLCISGIGCPETLSLTLKELGAAHVDRIDFPDHHQFQTKDLLKIKRKLFDIKSTSKQLPLIIITEKDYARNPEMFWRLKDSDVFILHSTLEVINDSGAFANFCAIIAKKIQSWAYESLSVKRQRDLHCMYPRLTGFFLQSEPASHTSSLRTKVYALFQQVFL